MDKYDDMEVKSAFSSVGFWAGDFDRSEYLDEFDGCTDVVVVFDPKMGTIIVHQFTPFMLPGENAGVSFSGISQKRISSGGCNEAQAREVFQGVFQLRNKMTLSK